MHLYSLTRTPEAIRHLFRVSSNRASSSIQPRDAIFPGHSAAIVRKSLEDGERELVELSWGFVPPQPGKAPRRGTNTRDDKVQSSFPLGSANVTAIPARNGLPTILGHSSA